MSAKMCPFAKKRSSLAVEIGVEEGGAPAHRPERGSGEARRLADVLELATVDVVVQRVSIVGECGEHEIDAPVAVVIAGVSAHPGLGPGLAVQCHACGKPHALEAAVPEVPVEEVGVGVVGHEEIDEPIVIVVGRDDAEPVGAGRIGEAMRRRRPR